MKSKGLFNVTILLQVILLILPSCTEIFFPSVKENSDAIIVDGGITNEPGPYEISLFHTIPLTKTQDTLIAETGATIVIFDDKGNSDLFQEIKPGVYQNKSATFKGEVGTSYWIEILTSKGDKYESSPEEMPSPYEIETLYGEEVEKIIDIDNSRKGLELYFNAVDKTNSSNCFRWKFDESWEWHTTEELIPRTENPSEICYPTQHPNTIRIFNATSLEQKRIEHMTTSFIGKEETKLSHAYVLSIQLHSITQNAYLFWNNIKTIVQNNGSLYDVIPTNAPGNLQLCEGITPVWGYFEVSSIYRKVEVLKASDFEMEFPLVPEECELLIIKGLPPEGEEYHIITTGKDPIDDETIYYVRRWQCYDCAIKYPRNKPSFWP